MSAVQDTSEKNEYHCSKCSSENTQNIGLLISSGTHNVDTETSSSGVGVSAGGRVGVGSSSSYTSGTVVSQLALKFKEPTSFEAQLQTFASGASAIIAIIVGLKFSSFWIGLGAFFGIALALMFVLGKLFKSLVDKSNEKKSTWEKWRDNGYFCHRCGHAFIPGSSEAYVFETED